MRLQSDLPGSHTQRPLPSGWTPLCPLFMLMSFLSWAFASHLVFDVTACHWTSATATKGRARRSLSIIEETSKKLKSLVQGVSFLPGPLARCFSRRRDSIDLMGFLEGGAGLQACLDVKPTKHRRACRQSSLTSTIRVAEDLKMWQLCLRAYCPAVWIC